MAIDDADKSDPSQLEGEVDESASDPGGSEEGDGSTARQDEEERPDETGGGEADAGPRVAVGEYTWADFMEEYGYGHEVSSVYPTNATTDSGGSLGLDSKEDEQVGPPTGDDWDGVEFEPEEYLGFHPDDLAERITEEAAPPAKRLWTDFKEDIRSTPVVKDEYWWEHYKWDFYYEEDGDLPRDADGEVVEFDREEALGHDPEEIEGLLSQGQDFADELHDLVEERTVNVRLEPEAEDDFFSTQEGHTTVANRYDLEKEVPQKKKSHFREEDRYWVNKPYSFVILFHSEKENEKKYYAVEPYLTEIEEDLQEFLTGKLRTAIKYADEEVTVEGGEEGRKAVIEKETRRLLERYDLFDEPASGDGGSFVDQIKELVGMGEAAASNETEGGLDGIAVRPEPAILADDPDRLNEYQVEKLLYLLKRDFIGYERIDPIKHDINVEDISCNGYHSPVFVYHTDYEQIISNIYHGEEELDDFVVKLAQRSGKGISKRRPQVDATLPDGSRSQLTLGREVSDHGTNYTIRQFKDVPFTPVDLINWNTFSLDEMAFLWLCIENHKSLIFAGGTASGKTTSLNAISLFIPSNTKIVSIEDTREVELPQRNWIASVTRPSFSDDSQGDVDEFDLLEAALRQRPDYIVMGEIRGEEGRTLFQVMSTGHTTYTTFHADSVGEVLKRFTTDPINVSKTMFTALDLVSIQTQTRVQGNKVRRNKSLTEINHYDAENDEINVQDVYQWQAETDEFLKMGDSNTLDEIQFDRGWSRDKLDDELFKRRVILAYLIKNGLNEYTKVAATVQAFINDPETILTLIANEQLEESLEDLREMESVLIDVDPEKEALVPRPDAGDEIYNEATDILERAEGRIFEEFRGKVPSGLGSALSGVSGEEEPTITADSADADEFEFGGDLGDADADFGLGDEDDFTFGTDADDDEAVGDEGPEWLSDDGFADESDGETADAAAEPDDAEPADGDRPAIEAGDPDDGDGSSDDELPALAAADEETGPEADASSAEADAATPPADADAGTEAPVADTEAEPADSEPADDGTDATFSDPTDDGTGVDASPAPADGAPGDGDSDEGVVFSDPSDGGSSPAEPASDDAGPSDRTDAAEKAPDGTETGTGGGSADGPGDGVATEQPDDGPVTDQPADETATDQPDDGSATSQSDDGATTDDPDTPGDEGGDASPFGADGESIFDDEDGSGDADHSDDGGDGGSMFGGGSGDSIFGDDDGSEDDGDSIFGGDGDEGGDSIFGDDDGGGGGDEGPVFDESDDGGDGSLFEDDGESIFGESDGESIFSPDDADEDDDSIFGGETGGDEE
ncbi:ATPase, T2SS/T4P/T4SS family [Halostella litorea]|uniref:ATPase, T2SS/T4P/T4SS family n=1 Tax=Halostella litorea TaxID=2528831 RepID=UPI001092C905